MTTDAATQAVKRVDPVKNRGGTWVRFGDEEYRVPALGFSSVIDLQEKVKLLRDVGTQPTPEQAAVCIELMWHALKRNYPEMKQEDVSDMLDLSNFSEVLTAVMLVSGFKRGDPPGETKASTGTGSIPP